MKSVSRLVNALIPTSLGRPAWPPKPVKPARPATRRPRPPVTPTPTAGTFVRERFIYEPESPAVVARRPEYWLYTPPSRGSTPPALMVMLHGCKLSAEALAHGTRMNALADREGFIVLYPECRCAAVEQFFASFLDEIKKTHEDLLKDTGKKGRARDSGSAPVAAV